MEENHEDIGRRILQKLRVKYDPTADGGVYTALFQLQYLRGVESSEECVIYVENGGLHCMTSSQQRFLEIRRTQLGPSKPWGLHVNDPRFIGTRMG